MGLATKKDGLEIPDFIIIKTIYEKKFTLYYYVKAWIIIVHDYVIVNAFKVIQVLKNNEKINMVL